MTAGRSLRGCHDQLWYDSKRLLRLDYVFTVLAVTETFSQQAIV